MRSPTLSSDPVSESKRTKSGSTPVLRIQDRIRFEISSKKKKKHSLTQKQSGSRCNLTPALYDNVLTAFIFLRRMENSHVSEGFFKPTTVLQNPHIPPDDYYYHNFSQLNVMWDFMFYGHAVARVNHNI
ncbi:hypothetical protein TNCV_1437951 [Trichonephila clavipes]|nr:hypothetical protein TNCV_1437951 [Trichonephila clavipes]